jgi:hypothetical protein
MYLSWARVKTNRRSCGRHSTSKRYRRRSKSRLKRGTIRSAHGSPCGSSPRKEQERVRKEDAPPHGMEQDERGNRLPAPLNELPQKHWLPNKREGSIDKE